MATMWLKLIILYGIVKNGAALIQDVVSLSQHIYAEYEERGLINSTIVYDPARARLGQFMRAYYEDAKLRVGELNRHRFLVETSFEYEMGYLMHELFDKYKKQVEQYNRGQYQLTQRYRNLTTFKRKKTKLLLRDSMVLGYEKIERTELSQKLYFDIYHITNMIHELRRKWKDSSKVKTSSFGEDVASYSGKNYNEREEVERQKRIADRKRKLKERQKELRDKIMKPGSNEDRIDRERDKRVKDFVDGRMRDQGWEAYRERFTPAKPFLEYGWDVPLPIA